MMKLKDYSEIKEAVALFSELLAFDRQVDKAVRIDLPEVESDDQAIPHNDLLLIKPVPQPSSPPEKSADSAPKYRDEQLQQVLQFMCQRGSFYGAIVADNEGLPLSSFNSPIHSDILAAYTSVLGRALEKAAQLLNQKNANNVSLDINYLDKIVLRRFQARELSFYLLVICQQSVDERSEIELTIEQIRNHLL